MCFEIKDKDLGGRIGRLRTKHGAIETPYVFPVINVLKQELPIPEIVRAGFNALITNAYLVYKRFGAEAIARKIHGVLGHRGPVMTDSGAYQILKYGRVDVSNSEIVAYQIRIDSDIAVILDVPTGLSEDKSEALNRVLETIRRAHEVSELVSKDHDESGRLWVLPLQGAPYLDLVELSAKRLRGLPYNIYAVGSPTELMENYDYESLMRVLITVRKTIPPGAPLHLFGAGHPMILPFAIAVGADLFDSAAYLLYARDGRYMTSYGTYRLEELDYLPCTCPVCAHRSPQELLELREEERVRLLALHNLYITNVTIRRVKQAIRDGRLWELLEELARAHPRLTEAFNVIVENYEFLERLAPRVKGRVRGMWLYGYESLYRPQVVRHREYIVKKYRPPARSRVLALVPGDLKVKPLRSARTCEEMRSSLRIGSGSLHLVFYVPFFGIVPEELAEVYPYAHFEAPSKFPERGLVLDDLVNVMVRYISAWDEKYKHVVLFFTKRIPWSPAVARTVKEQLSSRETVVAAAIDIVEV